MANYAIGTMTDARGDLSTILLGTSGGPIFCAIRLILFKLAQSVRALD